MDDGIRLGLKEESDVSKHRGFCIGLTVVLVLFAFLSWHKGRHHYPYYLAGSVLAAFIAAAKPSLIAPIYRPWMKAAGVLAEINGFIITAVIYFGLFLPYSWFLRMTGKNPLDRGTPKEGTYWLDREPAEDYSSYERQF